MGTLRGLSGIKAKEIKCEFIRKPADICKIIEKGYGATTADDNGAINIWKDDKGKIRCESMRSFISLEKKEFDEMESTLKWYRKWKKLIK